MARWDLEEASSTQRSPAPRNQSVARLSPADDRSGPSSLRGSSKPLRCSELAHCFPAHFCCALLLRSPLLWGLFVGPLMQQEPAMERVQKPALSRHPRSLVNDGLNLQGLGRCESTAAGASPRSSLNNRHRARSTDLGPQPIQGSRLCGSATTGSGSLKGRATPWPYPAPATRQTAGIDRIQGP